MGKRDDLIAKYADDLKNKCGITPDMDLLTKVTIGCGPSIYNADASTVAGSQQSELETVKNSFLVKKLGLADGPELMTAIDKVIETYGRSERNKYRAVVYYMLTKHLEKKPFTVNLSVIKKKPQFCLGFFYDVIFADFWVTAAQLLHKQYVIRPSRVTVLKIEK